MIARDNSFVTSNINSNPFSTPPHICVLALTVAGLQWIEVIPEPHADPSRSEKVSFAMGQRGSTLLVVDGFTFARNRRQGYKTYWICAKKVYSPNRKKQLISIICFCFFFVLNREAPNAEHEL